MNNEIESKNTVNPDQSNEELDLFGESKVENKIGIDQLDKAEDIPKESSTIGVKVEPKHNLLNDCIDFIKNQKKDTLIIAGIVATALFGIFYVFSPLSNNTKNIMPQPIATTIESDKNDLLNNISISDLENHVQDLEKQLKEKEKDIIKANDEVKNLKNRVKEQQNNIDGQKNNLLMAQKQLASFQNELAESDQLRKDLSQCLLKSNAISNKSQKKTPTRTTIAYRGPKASNFIINTIYSDQAWIQDKTRTYVVQVGDNINGLRILKIDPNKRQVTTSNGVIR